LAVHTRHRDSAWRVDYRAKPIGAEAWLPTRKDVDIFERSAVLRGMDGVIPLVWVLSEAVATCLKMSG
jgi:hypothetical protein